VKERLMSDLAACLEVVRKDPALQKNGSCAVYGSIAKVPTTGLLQDFLVALFSKIYKL
jgi:hypothetical protein